MCQGKNDFDHICEMDADSDFYCKALGIQNIIPSSETLRQRLDMAVNQWLQDILEVKHVDGLDYRVRIVFQVIEQTSRIDGQLLLEPELEVKTWWTSLTHSEILTWSVVMPGTEHSSGSIIPGLNWNISKLKPDLKGGLFRVTFFKLMNQIQ